jgi:hypothetical protein
VAAIIVALLLIPYRITYQAVEDNHVEAKTEVIEPQTMRAHIDALIATYSARYGVSASVMHTVIKCESMYNPRALGDSGYSRGLVQIHSKYWPEVTDEMAYDPNFAIRFLAEKLSTGDGHLWTCWRMSYN